MSVRYGSRSRPGTMVSTWLNGLVSGPVITEGGYFGGGSTSGGRATTVDRFTFPGDGRSTLSTGLTAGVSNNAAMANSGTAG